MYLLKRTKSVNIKKEFGEKIKRMRKSRHLTQEQFAEMIDISPRNLSGIEVGANFIKAETLEKIISALNTTTGELFGNEYLLDSETLIKNIMSDIKLLKNDRVKLEIIHKLIRTFIS